MHIESIEVNNFRSINSKKYMHPARDKLLVLVGPNNVGKSNFLRAINLFFNKEVEPGVKFDSKNDFNKLSEKKKTVITINIVFDARKDKIITGFIDKNYPNQFNSRMPISLSISSNNTFQYSFRNKKGQQRTIQELIDRILDYTNCVYIPSIKDYKSIINLEFIRQIVSYTFQGWGRGRTSKRIGEQRKKFETNITDLQSMLDDTGLVASEIIRSVLSGIDKFHFALPYDNLEEFLGKLNLEITESSLQSKISLASEGSGIQSFVIYTMLRLLHELRPSNSIKKSAFIWLIEEPETFMHNDLQRKTMEKLSEYSKDGLIFITTHSPIFISKHDLQNVYWVIKDVESSLRPIEQTDLAELLAQSLGIKLQDYFIFNKINFLVEGESDKYILTNLIRIFAEQRIDEIPILKDMKFFVCKSTSTIAHFYTLYNTFNQFASFYVCVDGDDAGNKAINDLRKNGVEMNYIMQVRDETNKKKPEIEDMIPKAVWEECLRELDKRGLVTLKMQRDTIIDYEYKECDREQFKKQFSEMIIKRVEDNPAIFTSYMNFIRQINSRVSI